MSLEESIAVRNEALRELEEKLDDRKQLAVVDKKTLGEECARVSRHIVKIKRHEDMVKGAETLFKCRERRQKNSSKHNPQHPSNFLQQTLIATHFPPFHTLKYFPIFRLVYSSLQIDL